MSINSVPINAQEINGGVYETLSGTLVAVEQEVRGTLSGTLVGVEQTVELRETLSGTLIAIEQTVQGALSGTLIAVEQSVRDVDAGIRNYDYQFFLDGYQIPRSQLIDESTVQFNEDGTAVADVVLFPGSGVQDLSFYYSKNVIINASVNGGAFRRIFTGVVDTVDFDVIDSKTTLKCTNRRKELLEALPSSLFDSGYDISLIEDLDRSNAENIGTLIQYSAKSLDFDSYNQYHFTSWTPKATPDITFTGFNIFRRQPNIQQINRGRIVNKITIAYSYTYKRLHNVRINMFVDVDQGDWSDVLSTGKTLLSRSTVEAVSSAGGWLRSGSIAFVALPLPGWYGGRLWLGDAAISKTTNTGTTSSTGSVRETSPIATYNASRAHCVKASWGVYNRWVQEIQQNSTLIVQSNTSQAIFGVVERDASYSVTDTYDATRYTDVNQFTHFYDTGLGQTINVNATGFTDVQKDGGKANTNLQSAIVRAQVEILKSHRENTVTFETDLVPTLQLYHTVKADSDQIVATGKVSRYTHTIKFSEDDATTETEIKFYGLGTGGGTSALIPPTIATTNTTDYPVSASFGARYGVPPASNPDLVRAGFYGNQFRSGVYTKVTPQLVVDYPGLASGLTDGKPFSGSSSYNITVPTSTVVITYD